jgi:hypothetical protein
VTLGIGSLSLPNDELPVENWTAPSLPYVDDFTLDGASPEGSVTTAEPTLAPPPEPAPAGTTGPDGDNNSGSTGVRTVLPLVGTPSTNLTTPPPVRPPVPLPLAINTTRSLRWAGQPDQYLMRAGDLGNVGQVSTGSSTATKQAATFTVVAGLADPNCFSFTAGGRYLRHASYRLRMDFNDSSTLFRNDATFCAHTAPVSGAVCFESKNYTNYYIKKYQNELWIDRLQDTAAFRMNVSFYSVAAWV